jgi:Ca-activated chloride channel family protein
LIFAMSLLQPDHDDWIDLELGDVALPPGMQSRLRDIARYCDESIDTLLLDVTVPPGMIERLRKLSQPPQRQWGLRQMAIAASLMVAIGLSYLSSLSYFLTATYQSRPDRRAQLQSRLSALPVETDRPTTLALAMPIDVERAAIHVATPPVENAPVIELAAMPVDAPAASPAMPFALPGIDKLGGSDSLLVADRYSEQVLGAMRTDEENPELSKLPGLVPRGIEPTKEFGFNWAFLINKKFHPVVEVKRFPRLRDSRVPLDVPPESYQLVKHYVAEGELPPPDMVRSEEFLAAVEYGFPAAGRDKLALHVAGGPSPLGSQTGLQMLEIGVQAGSVASRPRTQGRHLIVLLDVSRSMLGSGRLENVQAALRNLVGALGKQDRLSLVTFSERAEVLIEDAGLQHADSLHQAIDALAIQAGTNVAMGLQAADRVAADWAWVRGRDQRVLLITDGLYELDTTSASLIDQWIVDPASHAAALSVLDAGMDPNQPQLGFKVSRAESINDFKWLLVEQLTDQPQVLARGAELTVRFNPKSVDSYRLLGHEPTLLSDSPRADLHAGETNVGLYELKLLPKGEDLVADVWISWVNPTTGKRERTSGKISRRSFAKDFSAATPSFQLGVLAAETAELLRHSPFRQDYKYETLRELAAQTSAAVQSSESFLDLMALVHAADRARPGRTTRSAWGVRP